MKILVLSPNYKYHQDLLESLFQKAVIAEFATSHNPENEILSLPFYVKHNTKLINGKAFYRIEKLQKLIPADAPALDKNIINYFEHVERDFYTLSDRYSYIPLSFRYRKRLFRLGLTYWLGFFERNNIDGVFSICAPHNFPDYLAFHVAKYLGIKTLLPTDTMINDHILLLKDYRQAFELPKNFMSGKSDEEIKNSINPKLLSNIFTESKLITLSKEWNDRMLNLKNVNTVRDKPKLTSKLAKLGKKIPNLIVLGNFKPKFKATFAMNGEFSDNRRRIFRIGSGMRLKKLKAVYEKLAIYPDYTQKFVYFAMHLNPERTTQPEAEAFEDQLLAIEILSRSVPENWLVYVKENPGQYGRKLNLVNGRHFRDKTDYEDFLRLPNVRLLRQDVKTVELIDKAAIVASLKGSVGWEAMEKGWACIIFAKAWYAACWSAFTVHDVKSCQLAIESILTKTAAEVFTDKLKFFSYMQEHIVLGSMGGHHNLRLAVAPYEELVENLAEKITDYFNVNNGSTP